ncbi:RluA family pseudouridine synthase [Teichococcus cervicalis]|uniref:Pseudouridine synthase, RluA family n=1 Tax=Pseudoroseomonas cervicalis ATCC 49957 TaxID=525371 RepID=D5RLB7_9PROT|nr:RNA pseudouridine synthase [Pseudoroseomonas cervicalis]EFH11904.1 pseudouridine synthase, RluA family [Pseudoroseomonas cervicalis ATCC 49957]
MGDPRTSGSWRGEFERGGAPLKILLQTEAVLVIDKPAGLPVHRGPRGGASLEDHLPALAQGKRHWPQPAHRLDTDTAGCLVLGRTKPALAALGRLFAEGRARKTYWAVVRGGPAAQSGRIDLPLRKTSSAATGWRMEAHPDGQPALTRWRVRGRGPGLAWLELRPETGRTHQLRVHCASQGWPILGDPFYGTKAPGGLHLLARAIELPLDPPLSATAPVPPALRDAFAACGWSEAA